MRNISFALTKDQFYTRNKIVTRRLKWLNLKPGTLLQGVVKGMGLKAGESIEPLAVIRVIDVRREPLNAITQQDVWFEGFQFLTVDEFVEMFCLHHPGVEPTTEITRIEFRFIPGSRSPLSGYCWDREDEDRF